MLHVVRDIVCDALLTSSVVSKLRRRMHYSVVQIESLYSHPIYDFLSA